MDHISQLKYKTNKKTVFFPLPETQETSTNHKPKDSRDKDDIIQPMAKIELKTSGIR